MTAVFGVGPVVAAIIIGHTGHVGRFPTAGHYARYNATAPDTGSSEKSLPDPTPDATPGHPNAPALHP